MKNREQKTRPRRSAFTLIEMLLVIVTFSLASSIAVGLILLTMHTDHSFGGSYQHFHALSELGERFREDVHHAIGQEINIENEGKILQLGNQVSYSLEGGKVQRDEVLASETAENGKSKEIFHLADTAPDGTSSGKFTFDLRTGLVTLTLNLDSAQLPSHAASRQQTQIILEALQPRQTSTQEAP